MFQKRHLNIFTFVLCLCLLFNFVPPFRKAIVWLYFDPEYYLAYYPDVEKNKIAALNHYVVDGWRKDRHPNKLFETISPFIYKLKARKVKLLKNPKYYLTLVAIFQNEARFLKEWIEFYRLMGVEHFYLYNHLSTDNYMEVLEPYIKSGIIELTQVKDNPKNFKQWNKLQNSVYTDAAKKSSKHTEWLIVVDTDEFLFPVQANNLQDALKKYDNYASISVNSKLFGSSNIERIPDDKLLIDTLIRSSTKLEDHVKTIVKPRFATKFTNPHYARLKFGYYQVTENFEYFTGPFAPTKSQNVIRVNHYWARDLEFFKTHKTKRIHANDLKSLMPVNKNASLRYDNTILRFTKSLKEKIFLNNN